MSLTKKSTRLLSLAAALLASACAENGLDTASLQTADPSLTPGAVERSELPPPGATVAQAAVPATDQPLATASLAPAPSAAPAEAPADLKPETAAAIRDARSLKEAGNKARALSMLDQTADADKDTALLLERGLLSLELGQVEKATELLKQAHDPKAPDWRQHSGLGAALSAQGQQQAAQAELAKALALAPDNPGVINNLALSYALDGKHIEAERLLRNAAEHPQAGARAKQNLALILGLRGNIAEARSLTETILPPDQVKANIAYLEELKTGTPQVSKAEPAIPQEKIRAIAEAARDKSSDAPIMNLGGPETAP